MFRMPPFQLDTPTTRHPKTWTLFVNDIRMRLLIAAAALCSLLSFQNVNAEGTWTHIANPAPDGISLMMLLSDGTVVTVNEGPVWYRLTPDAHGSYVNGTWSTLAPMHDKRLYFSSQVLKDGRVFVAGGEYDSGEKSAEVYDPVKNVWTQTPDPHEDFLDSVSEILEDGRVMVAPVRGPDSIAIYDPVANTWSAGPSALGYLDEVPWVKLPDNSILCPDSATFPNATSERYIPSLNKWVPDANIPVSLYSGGETGSGHLLPNGKVFFRGYTHTAIYTPSGNTHPGKWVQGPDIPGGLNCGDSPGAVMVNGNVLFTAGAGYLGTGPTSFFEYNSKSNTISQISGPTGRTFDTGGLGTESTLMLTLPDGTVLFTGGQTDLYVYQPSGPVSKVGQPVITNISPNSDGSYTLTGTGLNGVTEGASYGDDDQMATNFPIVQLSAGSNVYYARSYNWSSTGVATGNMVETVTFTLPLGIPAGTYSLVVSASGNQSAPSNLTFPSTANDTAPTVSAGPSASASPVIGPNTDLSVTGASANGESTLTYTWTSISTPGGTSAPSFSNNATNAAKSTTATFYGAGDYTLGVTITDAYGLSVSASVDITVNQTLSSAAISPSTASPTAGDTVQFAATAYDQFNQPMAAQPAFTWALSSGGGSVSSTGLYTSPDSGATATVTATVTAGSSPSGTANVYVASAPWMSADVGSPLVAGYGYDSNGTITVAGNGSDIYGTYDQFHYLYRYLGGDGVMIARVTNQTNPSNGDWTEAGIMIRNSTDPSDRYAFMLLSGSKGTTFQYRTARGGQTGAAQTTSGPSAPYWLKIVRKGNTVIGYRSADGITWTRQGAVALNLAASPLIGLAVDSFDSTSLNKVTFDQVTFLDGAPQTIAVDQGGQATIDLLAEDLVPAGSSVTITKVTHGTKGTVTITGNGTVTYVANSNATGVDFFTYTAKDGNGDAVTGKVYVTINVLKTYYRFNEGSGPTGADSSGHNFTATLHGAVWGNGVTGQGLAFNGSTGYASIPALNLNSNSVTISAWINPNDTQSPFAGLVFCRAGTTVSGLTFGTSNELRYTWNSTASTYNWNSKLVPPAGQWTFVALVITPTHATIFMQPEGGKLQSETRLVPNAVSAFDGETDLGRDPLGGRFYNGSMDEVRIYDRALSTAEIAALASAASLSFP